MEAAHGTFDLKGASGLLCCMKCVNCFKKGILTDTAHPFPSPDGRLADITSPTLDAFVPNTNEAIFANVDELQRLNGLVQSKAMTNWRSVLAEKACGMNHNPHGMLLDKALRTHESSLELVAASAVTSHVQDGRTPAHHRRSVEWSCTKRAHSDCIASWHIYMAIISPADSDLIADRQRSHRWYCNYRFQNVIDTWLCSTISSLGGTTWIQYL